LNQPALNNKTLMITAFSRAGRIILDHCDTFEIQRHVMAESNLIAHIAYDRCASETNLFHLEANT